MVENFSRTHLEAKRQIQQEISKLISHLPAEEQLLILAEVARNILNQSSGIQTPSPEPAIAEIIAELQANPRSEQPTGFEKMLRVFQENPKYIAIIDDLLPIINSEEGSDSIATVRSKVRKLAKKMSPKGFNFRHVLAYQIIPSKKE